MTNKTIIPDGLAIDTSKGTREEWEKLIELWDKFKPQILHGEQFISTASLSKHTWCKKQSLEPSTIPISKIMSNIDAYQLGLKDGIKLQKQQNNQK